MGRKHLAATLVLGGFLTCRGRSTRFLFASLHGGSSLLLGVLRTSRFAVPRQMIGSKWAAIPRFCPSWAAFDSEPGMWEWYAALLDNPMMSRRRDEEVS